MKANEVVASTIKVERLQTRAATNSQYVDDLADRMAAGDVFPPIVIFTDGKDSWLADGVHRLDAAIKAKKKIGVDERKGTRTDAIEFACGANASHGLRRTNADKHRSVKLALSAFPDNSSRAIAEMCCVGHTFVDDVRKANQVASDATCNKTTDKTRVGKDGKRQSASKQKPKKVEQTTAGTKISGGVSFDPLQLDSAAKTKSGEQVFDPRLFARWDDAFGKLKRSTDAISMIHGNGKLCRQLNEELNQAFDTKDKWKQSLA